MDSETLVLNLEGFEGPLDLLLELARAQKVDLAKISILALVDQYLAVIEGARRVRLELAADWLVMAAWLTWLKSRLLVPVTGEDEEAEIAAETLAARLIDLQRVRAAALWLGQQPLLGVDVFARGAPEDFTETDRSKLKLDISGLLSAYLAARRRAGAKATIPAEADGFFLGAKCAGTATTNGRLEAGLVEPGRVSAPGAGRGAAAQGGPFGNPDRGVGNDQRRPPGVEAGPDIRADHAAPDRAR